MIFIVIDLHQALTERLTDWERRIATENILKKGNRLVESFRSLFN